MACDGAIIFKLDVLRIECPKCERVGRYRVADLIARYGHDEKLFAWTDAPQLAAAITICCWPGKRGAV